MSIRFTQYLLPDGRTKTVYIDRPPEIEEKAHDLQDRGLVFEVEVLMTGMVSFTIEDHDEERVLAHYLVPNGPDIESTVDRLVESAYERINK